MNKKVKTLWLKALRSGEYKQVQLQLKRDDRYCCLGVLCDLAVKAGVIKGFSGRAFYLPSAVRAWAGLDGRNPTVTYRYRAGGITMSNLNDGTTDIASKSFKQIARYIERDL